MTLEMNSPSNDEMELMTMSCSLLRERTRSVSEIEPCTIRSTLPVDLNHSSTLVLRNNTVKGQSGCVFLRLRTRRAGDSLASGVEVQSHCPQPMRPVGPKRSTEGILIRVELSVESLQV
jgi:hypothetical protein